LPPADPFVNSREPEIELREPGKSEQVYHTGIGNLGPAEIEFG
jgi:hypothetical protein